MFRALFYMWFSRKMWLLYKVGRGVSVATV